jgi:hypothetical protein
MQPAFAFAFAFAAGALLAGAAHAVDVYKWTDSKGVVHYGDRPASGTAAATVTVPDDPGNAQDAAAAKARLERERARLALPTEGDVPAVSTPVRKRGAASACAQEWQRYNAAQSCFNRHRVLDGKGVTDAGVQACQQLPQPSCTR